MSQDTPNKWIRSGMFTTLHQISVVGLGMVNFMLLARGVSKFDFGVWVVYSTIVSIIETLREGFIKQPFIGFVSNAESDRRDYLGSSALFLNSIYSLLISLLLFTLSGPFETYYNEAFPLGSMLKVYAITNLLFIPFSHFEYLQQSKMDFKGIFLGHFIRSLGLTITIITLFLSDTPINLVTLVWVSLISNAIGATVCILSGWKYKHKFTKPQRSSIKDMLGFGKYSLGTNIAFQAVRNTDSMMVGKMISPSEAAMYNPGVRILALVEMPTVTIANLVFPKMSQNFNKDSHRYAADLYEKSLGLLMALIIPVSVFVFIFAEVIVWILYGEKFLDSAYLLRITAFFCFFLPFGRQFGIFLDAVRKPQINFYFVLGSALINLPLNYYFIQKWGITGAAIGTLITYALRFTVQQILLYKMFDIFTGRVFLNAIKYYKEGYGMLQSALNRYGRSKK